MTLLHEVLRTHLAVAPSEMQAHDCPVKHSLLPGLQFTTGLLSIFSSLHENALLNFVENVFNTWLLKLLELNPLFVIRYEAY